MKLVFTFLFLLVVSGFTQQKDNYDLPDYSNTQKLGKTSFAPRSLQNNVLSTTLIDGGYFTIGTVNGLSNSTLDNNCTVTYGHPFALTSYPVFCMDGNWYRFDEYFTVGTPPSQKGDTLRISAQDEDLLQVEFSLYLQGSYTLGFRLNCKNLDATEHEIGLGIILDPSMGKSDGAVLFNGQSRVSQDTAFTENISQEWTLWEKASASKGLGAGLSWSTAPGKMIIDNWQPGYKQIFPDIFADNILPLYDLEIRAYWLPENIASGASETASFTLNLKEPEFNRDAFIRWDAPNYIDLENGLMFPRNFNTYVEVARENSGNLNTNLDVEMPKELESSQTNYTLSLTSNMPTVQKLALKSNIVYEDKVVETSLKVSDGGGVIDELRRMIYIPATPVSDSGLTVSIDSMSLAKYPTVQLFFDARKTSSGTFIPTLGNENIFLYENGLRQQNFSVAKDTSGGASTIDVAFVLDVSGSMGDEKDQVVQYLGEFADSLAARGYDYRIGVVTFSTTIDHIYDFTDDIDQVKANLSAISLWGGIEDDPLALYTASQLSYRENSKRTIIWITDEPYPETSYTKEEVVNRMLEMGITVHGVGLLSLQTDWFNPIVIPTGGNFYDINGNFRDILLDISRLKDFNSYMLSYTSESATNPTQVELQIRYAGLGGQDEISFNLPDQKNEHLNFSFYPNPFNPVINFRINSAPFVSGDLSIYNTLGQRIRQFKLGPGDQVISWNATDAANGQISSGMYLVKISLKNAFGKTVSKNAKILFLK